MRVFALFFVVFLVLTQVEAQGDSDSLIFNDFLNYARREKLVEKKVGDRIVCIATYFIDRPYAASTLEAEGTERLLVNLRELDCTTFVETVLALHNVLKDCHPDFEAYKRILTAIRYRNGVVDEYPSRLHYTTDWLINNAQKGYIRFVSMGEKTRPFRPAVNYMSTHSECYPMLNANPTFQKEVASQEKRINTLTLHYLPKEELSVKAPFLHSGDIVAITTGVSGLDFSHLGFAVRRKRVVYLLHASSSGKKVLLSKQCLRDYLADIKKHTGVVVVRPN